MQQVPTTLCLAHVMRVRDGCAECHIDKVEGLLAQWRDFNVGAVEIILMAVANLPDRGAPDVNYHGEMVTLDELRAIVRAALGLEEK